jgi:hypothetical protein
VAKPIIRSDQNLVYRVIWPRGRVYGYIMYNVSGQPAAKKHALSTDDRQHVNVIVQSAGWAKIPFVTLIAIHANSCIVWRTFSIYHPEGNPSAREKCPGHNMYRLCTGHCRLHQHLRKTGLHPTALCECGLSEQTPEHILQTCPNMSSRQHFWLEPTALKTKLWGTAEDLRNHGLMPINAK